MNPILTRRRALAIPAAAGLVPGGAGAGGAARCGPAGPLPRPLRVRDGLAMAYREMGAGDPIVFLHGNPTSSYLWRKILPYAAPYGRAIAPDLIGMGRSDKLPDSRAGAYSFATHRDFLDAFLAAVGADRRLVFVAHDWGGPLAFDWTRRHPDRVRAIVFMETFVWRIPLDGPAPVLDFYRLYRSEEGARAVLEENQFVEKVLLAQVGDALSDDEIAEYRRPFLSPGESRRSTLDWPRQVPIGGDPEEMAQTFDAFLGFMATTPVAKLWINATPGALIPEPLKAVPRSWPNLQEARVAGGHFLQETAPHGVGRAIAGFLANLDQG